jgi:hypothetical protein
MPTNLSLDPPPLDLVKKYRLWLFSAYHYYWGDGSSLMSDHEWDTLARQIVPYREHLSELRGHNYQGGSLFWLPASSYPFWAKLPVPSSLQSRA